MRKLRERPRRFIDLYCTPGQPAYLNVGLSALGGGYGKGNVLHARQHGCLLKQVPEVKAEIDKRLAEVERDFKARALLWVEEAEKQALVDVGDLFDDDGNLIPVRKLPEHVRRAIASIEVERRTEGKGDDAEVFYVHKIKLHDKKASQELLLKYAGKLKDVVQHEGKVTLEELVAESMKPSAAA